MIWKILAALAVALVIFIYVARRVSSTVHVEHVFSAPVSKVWAVWVDPEAMKKWWSPKDFTAPVIHSHFRVGGKFLLSMKSPKGEMFWNTGTYTEIVPERKIVSQMSFSDEAGQVVAGKDVPVPGVWPDAITVSVEFHEEAGKTRVTVTEVGIPLIMKLFAKMGWQQQFVKFEALL